MNPSNMDINYRSEFKKFLKNSFRRYKLDFVEQSLIPAGSSSNFTIPDVDEFLRQIECRKISAEKRINDNAVIEERSTERSPKVSSVCSNEQTTPSKNSNFKRRTSLELINMVKRQCKEVENLNIINSYTDGNMVLPPSVLLWRSKRKFSSSIDLHSNILQRSKEYLSPKESCITSSRKLSGTTKRAADMTDEEIVRDQIIGPLIRDIEQVYVQSITTTAVLLKKLDCMPSEINRILARKRKLKCSS